MSTKKNGYFRVPTVDPDDLPKRPETVRSNLPNLKPGLFVMFGKDRRPVKTVASDSGEEIELAEFKPRKPKHRRVRTPKSPVMVKREKFETIEEPLLPGDTLQRVALRYACAVSMRTSMRATMLQLAGQFPFTCSIDSSLWLLILTQEIVTKAKGCQ